MMVDGQVRTADVTDPRLLAALLETPRERFVPAAQAGLAYLDCDVPVGPAGARQSRRLLKPMVLAKLLQTAEIDVSHLVLDVGCATGYASAIIARLAGTVVALEEDPALAGQAKRVLRDLGLANVMVATGPLNAGWPPQAPYDAIILNGAVEVIPDALFGQIKEGGCLAGILGTPPAGKAMLYRRHRGQVSGRPIFDAAAPPLPGFSKPVEFVF
jgi:protein-L-isoaspartate(D-aspartate) O-methyltransferase